nr:MAG TPA: hypothetical protein [Caudoviricetes sp.]
MPVPFCFHSHHYLYRTTFLEVLNHSLLRMYSYLIM